MHTLDSLASTVPGASLRGGGGVAVSDLAYDSRTAGPGALFFCVPGARNDGHDHAHEAVARGAVAVVCERPLDIGVPQLVVASSRRAMAPIAAAYFAHPSRALTVVGVTGTNGKTTTAFMLEGCFRALGLRSGVIGTVEYHVGDRVLPVTRTTPEAIDLQRLLAVMRDEGVRAAAMEASSEGLLFERVEGTRFACAVFTNLTQDHLNTHGTMDAYFEAKALLFRPAMSERAVVNAADPWGRRLLARLEIPVRTFAVTGDADVRAASVAMDPNGTTLVADVRGAEVAVRIGVPGPYNVENALAALAAIDAAGLSAPDAAVGIAGVHVPGRLEPVEAGQDFTVVVDYAHTPDSLGGLLRAARAITPDGARLVVVFGCGGDRDRGKRPLMGRVAADLADRAIITSDNPRSEDPAAIVAEIEAGAREAGRPYEAIVDRRDAIAAALAGAGPGDVIVIAGKGHETGQQFADRTIPFDDRAVAHELLEELGWSRSR